MQGGYGGTDAASNRPWLVDPGEERRGDALGNSLWIAGARPASVEVVSRLRKRQQTRRRRNQCPRGLELFGGGEDICGAVHEERGRAELGKMRGPLLGGAAGR